MKKSSVLIIIVDGSGRILLQHRDIHAARNPNTWSLWSGTIEPNESPITAAQRELTEELGIEVAAEKLELFKVYEAPDKTRYVFVLVDKEDAEYAQMEGDSLKRVSLTELGGMNINKLSEEILSDYINSQSSRSIQRGSSAFSRGALHERARTSED